MAGRTPSATGVAAVMPGKVYRLSGEKAEYDCVISNISELGCKAAIQGADPAGFPPDTALRLAFAGDLKFSVTAQIRQNPENVPGWGIQADICFRRLNPIDRNHVMHLLYGNSRYVDHKSSQVYRRRKRKHTVKAACLVCAALAVGFAAVLCLKEVPEAAENIGNQAIGAAKSLALDNLARMTPEERRSYLESASSTELDALRKTATSLSEETKRKLGSSLGGEEKIPAK